MKLGAWLAAAAGGALLAGGAVWAQSAAESPAPAPTQDAFDADMSVPWAEARYRQVSEAVAPHIHVLRQTWDWQAGPIGNVVVIEQRDGLVLVDAGVSKGSGERIVSLVRSISAKPVKAVIITHWHGDHMLGLPAILEAWPSARVIMTAATWRDLQNPANQPQPHRPDPGYDATRLAQLHGYAREFGAKVHDLSLSPEERLGWSGIVGVLALRMRDAPGTYIVAPTTVFTDQVQLADPDAPVIARAIGTGHTDSDVVVWAPRQRVLAAGDIVVSPVPYPIRTMAGWEAELRRIRSDYAFDVLVPGHGVPERDTAFLDRLIAAAKAMRGRAQALSGQSLSDDLVLERADVEPLRETFARDDPWLRYWFDNHFLPGVVAAYHEIKAAAAHGASQ